uniref:Replication factor C small subunit n=1 Tax=viral metagenome TaxID=1070528 RepID=A0A6C0AXD0_9ZZZZ|tara:strand:- start:2679 stop:3431 length:753 start_codon:yes stop_codon:yes gene_type:complete
MIYHESIYDTLNHFIDNRIVPHLLFYGENGSGKKRIVNDFITKNYQGLANYKDYIMYVECAHSKGIKFVREDIKFFAKKNISLIDGIFKTIILNNADKLTIDAQSALRRCIEQFSHSTRFIIIVEDKLKILKPILSRFCEIYVHLPKINDCENNFYNHNNELIYKKNNKQLLDILNKLKNSNDDLISICEKIYKKGFSGIDILNVIKDKKFKIENKYELLITLNKERLEYYNEKMFILVLINTIRCNFSK